MSSTRSKVPDPRADASFVPTDWTFKDGRVASGFDRHVREQLPWYDLVTGALAHFVRHYLPEKGLVYDLGASTGNVGRAVSDILVFRDARLIPVEPSRQMADQYAGPGKPFLVCSPAESVDFEPCDVVVLFLSLMFVPVKNRVALLKKAFAALRAGGALLVVDKVEPPAGYPGTVMRRLTLAGKRAAGVPAEEIVSKELSLSGVQRPLREDFMTSVFPNALEWFRFGEFRGWSVES